MSDVVAWMVETLEVPDTTETDSGEDRELSMPLDTVDNSRTCRPDARLGRRPEHSYPPAVAASAHRVSLSPELEPSTYSLKL